MERRTRKIVGMAEANLEDSLESKVEAILQNIEAIQQKQEDMEKREDERRNEMEERASRYTGAAAQKL